jgi:outer membrane protein assembly factor BamB
MRRSARCLSLTLTLWAAVLAAVSASAQEVRRYIYAAVPGIGNDEKTGGVGVLVFDADNGYKFVRRIATWETYRREAIEPVKGIAAHAGTGRLYVSTTRRLAAFDLNTDKIVWQKGYDADCCDRMAVSADGKTVYVPAFNLPKWYVVDASTGNVITTIVTEGEAHNTIYSPHSGLVYLASLRTPTMAIADSRTHQVVKRVGPFSNQTRPFAINGKETLVYVNVNNLLGVAVGDLKTGKVLHEVAAPGFAKGKPKAHGTVSHGIALTYDEKEIWVADGPNSHAHIFDATSTPPKYKESVKLRAEPGWFTCSIDGKLIYPSSGEVIDIASRKIIATLEDEKGRHVETEKLLQIDFAGGRPVRAGDQFCFGQVR